MGKVSRVGGMLLVVAGFFMFSWSSHADPGQGHGGKQHKERQKDKGNKGNSNNKSHGVIIGDGAPLSLSITYNEARSLAVQGGLVGYSALPPGIAKNLARGKPLPPGIAKKMVPVSMLNQLPHYPGYEWRIAGNDLVLIALSTAIVTTIINNVFD